MIPTVPYKQRFKSRKPRIFVGLVAFGDIYQEVASSWIAWAFHNGAKYKDRFEVFFGTAGRKEQYRARNSLVRDAMEAGADFLLQVDDDEMVFECPDMLERFYELEKPVQCALTMQRGNSPFATVMKTYPDGKVDFIHWDEVPREPSPVEYAGGGCTWTDMLVFDFLAEPHWWPYPMDPQTTWFKPDTTLGLDLHFCKRVRELGFDVWLNTNVTLGHVERERGIARVPEEMRTEKACPTCGSMMVGEECRVAKCGDIRCRGCATPLKNGKCVHPNCQFRGSSSIQPRSEAA